MKEAPYLEELEIRYIKSYNPKYGDERMCKCGHLYYRHFDSYDYNNACGCKYCDCYEFIEKEKHG